MGILNVTPDSFSDGGQYASLQSAVDHGLSLIEDGADIVDVGGESTRPGAAEVGVEEEIRRTRQVVAELADRAPQAILSIDTTKAPVARMALQAGASIVNDISGLGFDPTIAEVVAEHEAWLVLMHIQGTPRTMQNNPRYDDDVVSHVCEWLMDRVERAVTVGVRRDRVIVDPGFGFGKTVAHNVTLLQRLDEICALGFPVLVGTSRKSFLGALTGRAVDGRVAATVATTALAIDRGAAIVRVHDVGPSVDALRIAAPPPQADLSS